MTIGSALTHGKTRRRRSVYHVKSIFLTAQGEGHHCGRPAVFCRFAGCNLWSGREHDRARAVCRFCDTDFVGTDGAGGGVFRSAAELSDAIVRTWVSTAPPFVVITGGEPTLQLDQPLIESLHRADAEVAIETNGTRQAPVGLDWVCVSPKAGAPLRQRSGDELKVVWPQVGLDLAELERLPFTHHFLQPLDDPRHPENVDLTVRACKDRPLWQLSLQLHKIWGIP